MQQVNRHKSNFDPKLTAYLKSRKLEDKNLYTAVALEQGVNLRGYNVSSPIESWNRALDSSGGESIWFQLSSLHFEVCDSDVTSLFH